MDRRERWKLAAHLNVHQVVLLMAGYDPVEYIRHFPQDWPEDVKQDIEPFLAAITNGVLEGRIRATIAYRNDAIDVVDWTETRIDLESFRDWLGSRNFRDDFFALAGTPVDPVLDTENEYYAPKLAAAVRAWKEVTSDPDILIGKTPKKALEIWLKKNGAEYGLLDDEGNPIKQALTDICKVANWRPEGGASPTPVRRMTAGMSGAANPSPPQSGTHPPAQAKPSTHPPAADLDDEIPF